MLHWVLLLGRVIEQGLRSSAGLLQLGNPPFSYSGILGRRGVTARHRQQAGRNAAALSQSGGLPTRLIESRHGCRSATRGAMG